MSGKVDKIVAFGASVAILVMLCSLASPSAGARPVPQIYPIRFERMQIDCACAADVDGDGLDEVVVGGVKKMARPGIETTQYYRQPVLFAAEPSTGATLWEIDLADYTMSVQLAGERSSQPGDILVISQTGVYSLFDSSDGSAKSDDLQGPLENLIFEESIDLDADGANESIEVTNGSGYSANILTAYEEGGAQSWAVQIPQGAQGGWYRALRSGNLDNDDATELVFVTGDYTAYCYDGETGALEFTLETGDFGFLELLDVNADGRLDIVATRYVSGEVYGVGVAAYNGTGPGLLWQSGIMEKWLTEMRIADFDSDGKPEVMLCQSENGGIQFLNAGNGTLERRIDDVGGLSIVEDLDGDGDIEVLTSHWIWDEQRYYSGTQLKVFDLATLALEWQGEDFPNVSWTTSEISKEANGAFAGALVKMDGMTENYYYAFSGSAYPTAPINLDNVSSSRVVLADLDGDGTQDWIIVSAGTVDWSDADLTYETYNNDTHNPWQYTNQSSQDASELAPVVIAALVVAVVIVSIIAVVLLRDKKSV